MPQRTVFLGTSAFAATVLEALARSRHPVALVVTPPDRRQGRGRRTAPPPAAQAALALGLDLHQADDVNESQAIARIRGAKPDAGVVCAFGQIVRGSLLSELELLNVHPSLLPRWRGAAPIERALMAGDGETGVTIMRLGEGLDSGPVALREAVAIDPDDDHGSLEARLAALGGELMVRALDLRDAGELRFTEQDDSLATYAEKVSRDERRLDPARPAVELARAVRALTPHIGAYIALDGDDRLAVRRATAEEGEGEPGLLRADGERLLLGTGSGILRLDVVQPPGGREMPAADYLRGHGLPAARAL